MTGAEADLTLTIDGGGTSVKVSAYSLRSQRTVAATVVEYSASYPAPELAEFDPASWWAAVVRAMRDVVGRALAPPASYVGITCMGMRNSFVLTGADGEALAPGVLNVDRRGQRYLDRVRAEVGSERLYQLTGHWPNAKFGLPKLLWFPDKRPEVWRRVRHVLQFHDWLIAGLCDELVSEPSSAARSQLVDVRTCDWAVHLLDLFGLERALFPQMLPAGTRAGGLLAAVAQDTGLLPGTPVHVGGGDSHVSAFGAGGVGTGDISIIGGSTTPVMLATEKPLLDPVHVPLVSPHLRPGLWAAETNAGVTGIFYTWLRDLLGGDGDEGPSSYARVDELAASSPPGARRPDCDLRQPLLGRGRLGTCPARIDRRADARPHPRRRRPRRPGEHLPRCQRELRSPGGESRRALPAGGVYRRHQPEPVCCPDAR